MTGWDRFAAELADTRQAERAKKRWRHCLYCGRRTLSTIQVCCAHTDLPALDETGAPPPAVTADGLTGVASGRLVAPVSSSAASLPVRPRRARKAATTPEPCRSPEASAITATNGEQSVVSGAALALSAVTA